MPNSSVQGLIGELHERFCQYGEINRLTLFPEQEAGAIEFAEVGPAARVQARTPLSFIWACPDLKSMLELLTAVLQSAEIGPQVTVARIRPASAPVSSPELLQWQELLATHSRWHGMSVVHVQGLKAIALASPL